MTGGASSLINDCVIYDGNPADTTLTDQLLDRQRDLYGRYPLKVTLGGGFASKENCNSARSKHIKDVYFATKRGIEIEEMFRSPWVYRRLRRFRAGMESGISWLNGALGYAVALGKVFNPLEAMSGHRSCQRTY